MKKRNNDIKRHCKDIKKIIQTKWRSLTFTKSVTRRLTRFHSLKKHHQNQMNLKKHQGHSNQMNLKKYQSRLMIQVRKNRSLKKHQVMEKKTTTRTGKKVKKTPRLKKAPTSPEFIDSSEESEELEGTTQDD